MSGSGISVELRSVDDLFSTEESRQDAAREKVMEIALSELYPFPDHPFSIREDDSMKETVQNSLLSSCSEAKTRLISCG